jgi:hypothetical protein
MPVYGVPTIPGQDMGVDEKPHVVCVPFQTQGHITPVTKLAKVLHSKGFHLTLVKPSTTTGATLAPMGLTSWRASRLPLPHHRGRPAIV